MPFNPNRYSGKTRHAQHMGDLMRDINSLEGFKAAQTLTPALTTEYGIVIGSGAIFTQPRYISSDSTGNIYVTDYSRKKVIKFSQTGTYLTEWGTAGAGAGQFGDLRGVTVDGSGNVLVADASRDKIIKFSSTGTYQSEFSVVSGTYGHPIAVHYKNSYVYVGTDTGYIVKYTTAGVVSSSYLFLLSQVINIAVDSSDYVYATYIPALGTDYRPAKIDMNSASFTVLGTMGTGAGQFQNPSGICVGDDNLIRITDTGRWKVISYSGTSYVSESGTHGTNAGEYQNPFSVCTSSDGYVFVVDSSRARVLRLQITGTLNLNYARNCVCYCVGQSSGKVLLRDQSYLGSYGRFAYVLDPTLTTLTTIAGYGGISNPGYVRRMCEDDSGNIYVAVVISSSVYLYVYNSSLVSTHIITNVPYISSTFSYLFCAYGGYLYSVTQSGYTINLNKLQISGSSISVISSVSISGSGTGKVQAVNDLCFDSTTGYLVINGNTGSSSPKLVTYDTSLSYINEKAISITLKDYRNQYDSVGSFCYGGFYNLTWNNYIYGFSVTTLSNVTRIKVPTTSSYAYAKVFGFNPSQLSFYITYQGPSYKISTMLYPTSLDYNVELPDSSSIVLSTPTDATVDGTYLYITDTANHRVGKYSKIDGAYISSFGTSGSGNGQFSSPKGITKDSSGNLWVVDSGNNRVQKLSNTGSYISKFGSAGSGNGQFNSPDRIFIDASDNIYVTDKGNNRVQVFDSAGTYLRQFGTAGSGNGNLSNPVGIAKSPVTGHVYVMNTSNNRAEVFYEFNATTAKYVSRMGKSGSGTDREFSSPEGVDVDSLGHLWVVDTGNNRVYRMSSHGRVNTVFGSAGSGDNLFNSPSSVVVDSNSIYIVDRGNSRVHKYNVWESSENSNLSQTAFQTYLTNNSSDVSIGVTPDGGVHVPNREMLYMKRPSSEVDEGVLSNLGTTKYISDMRKAIERLAASKVFTDVDDGEYFDWTEGSNSLYKKAMANRHSMYGEDPTTGAAKRTWTRGALRGKPTTDMDIGEIHEAVRKLKESAWGVLT